MKMNMKNIKQLAITAITMTALATSLFAMEGSIDFDSGRISLDGASRQFIFPPIPEPALADELNVYNKVPTAKWTVMVFINAKNNLEMAGLYNMNEMEKVGSRQGFNIVTEFGRMEGQDYDTDLDGGWTGSRRYQMIRDNDPETITSPVLMDTPNADMGDYRRVIDFVKWSKSRFPADKYMLIIWNHGSGWLDPKREKKDFTAQGISFDNETGNYVSVPQMVEIMKQAGPVDILATDACLMQSMEVTYELRNYAKIIMGSEETIFATGYDYAGFLDELAADTSMSA